MAAAAGHNGLIPLTSQALKQPCILRRKRRSTDQENREPKLLLPSSTPISSQETEEPKHTVIHNLLTPLKTPVKHLPFSPSRVSVRTILYFMFDIFIERQSHFVCRGNMTEFQVMHHFKAL